MTLPILPAIAASKNPVAPRFWAKAGKRTPKRCWDWHGSVSGWGKSGQFAVCGWVIKATRVAWALHYGTEPGDLLVRQRCGNRLCVNPSHLYLADKRSAISEAVPRGERCASCKLSQRLALRVKFGGERRCALARELGINVSTISDIRKGRQWAWMPARTISMTVPQMMRGEFTLYGRVVRSPGTRQHRQLIDLLAILLVSDPNRFLSLADLTEALWDDPDLEPDYSPEKVRVLVHRLRKFGVPIESETSFGWRIPEWARLDQPERLAA